MTGSTSRECEIRQARYCPEWAVRASFPLRENPAYWRGLVVVFGMVRMIDLAKMIGRLCRLGGF